MSTLAPPKAGFFSQLGLMPVTQESFGKVLAGSTPLLAGRIRMLGGTNAMDWLGSLTWDFARADTLRSLLLSIQSYEEPVMFLGFQALDQETYVAHFRAAVQTELLQSSHQYLWFKLVLVVDESSAELIWRLNEVCMDEPKQKELLLQDIDELKEYIALSGKDPSAGEQGLKDPDDDYWAQYDESEEEGTTREDLLASHTTNEADYYNRYEAESKHVIGPAAQNDSDADQGQEQYGENMPAIVRHIENSIKSLRELARSSKLTDEQFHLIFNKVMQGACELT